VARLLVVHHTPSPACHALLDAVRSGATDPSLAEAGVLGTPANLGYMSGALKHFFDVIYYPCLDATRGRPWSLWVHGNNDVDGAVLAVERIVTGLAWRPVAEPLRVIGEPDGVVLEAAWELGARTAAALVG
jgi:hypothetical protein